MKPGRLISDKDRELLKRLAEVRTADVIDALDRYNVYDSTIMSEDIRPLFNDIKMVGVALAIRLVKAREPIPNMSPEEYDRYASEWYRSKNNAELLLRVAEPGHVLVADAGGYTRVGFWGSYIALIARDRGIVGLVIDGGCRDVAEIRRERFPVFCRGVGRTETVGRLILRPEDVNIPVTVGDVPVEPGDLWVTMTGLLSSRGSWLMLFQRGRCDSFRRIVPTRSLIWRSLAYGFRRVEDGLLDGGIRKNYCFEGDRGENLLETIETTARANRVANGVIISAIGTLENCCIHRVTSQKLPPEEEYVDIDGPLK